MITTKIKIFYQDSQERGFHIVQDEESTRLYTDGETELKDILEAIKDSEKKLK